MPGEGQTKRLYGLSDTAREKWLRKECDRIIEYLRVRRLVDFTEHSNPEQEYTSPFIRQIIKLALRRGNVNYLGVQIYRDEYLDGMVGDTMYQEFFYEFYQRPRLIDWLLVDERGLHKLIAKYKKCYHRRGRDYHSKEYAEERKLLPGYYKKLILGQFKTGYDNKLWNSYKNLGHVMRQDFYERNFKWRKLSHKKTKKKQRSETEREISKTRQSLLALASITKHNVLIDDRWHLMALSNHKDEETQDNLFVFDHKLQREHIYLRVGSNKMTDPKSIWDGTMKGVDHISHFQNKLYSQEVAERKNIQPTLPPFKLNEKYQKHRDNNTSGDFNGSPPYVLDVSNGGYIDGGAHNQDSILTWDGDEHIFMMRGEYVLTTASVTYMFGNGCNWTGAMVLSMLMNWGHGLKRQQGYTTGKHYERPRVPTDEDGEELDIEEKVRLYHELLNNN